MAPWLTVVVPTYNEAANIGPLLTAVRAALGSVPAEFIVVDDDSKDGTPAAAQAALPEARVIVRTGERGLATAVVRGIREAQGTYVAVMDADFQHPPEAVLALLEKALDEDADLVIGSRYAPGGSAGNFGPVRRVISWGAGTIGRLALPPIRRFGLTDPMSGLFLVRRDKVDPDALRPEGYKILLEILGRCPLERVAEVGYVFGDRRGGDSKLGAGVIGQYLKHAATLGAAHPDNRRLASFLGVGLTGALLNVGLLVLLHGLLGVGKSLALVASLEVSILSNFVLNDRFTFQDLQRGHVLRRASIFNLVSLVGAAVNFLVFHFLVDALAFHYVAAEAVAILVAFGVNWAGNLDWTYGKDTASWRDVWTRVAPWVPVVLLTGAAAGVYVVDLDRVHEIYFDEHYYVSVARQMDNGVWEDPCWGDHRPLNYEHPPLAKLLVYWSVKDLDSDHAVFTGCRSPDNSDTLATPCNVVEHGVVLGSYDTTKKCYDAYTARAKDHGNPYAWRLPSAVLGTLAVLFAALAGQRLFGTMRAGLLAGTLVLLDTLVYTSARIAILDVFAAGFTAGAVWAATFPTRKGLLWTAIFLGLAFSCKYTTLFAGPAVFALALWTQRRAGKLGRRRFDLAAALFALVPLAIWIGTYWPWWVRWVPANGWAWTAKHWYGIQKDAFGWGVHGYQSHPYASPPIEWFALHKPTWYYHIWNLPGGKEGWVYAVGNPVLWWIGGAVALGALLWVPVRWVAALRSGQQSPLRHALAASPLGQAIAVSALLPAVAYAGFFTVNRVTFLFYMTLVIPLLCLPLAGTLEALWRRGSVARGVAIAALLACLAGFLYYYPVASSLPMLPADFHRIMHTIPWMSE